MNHIVPITVILKAGVTQNTRWLITHTHSYPCLGGVTGQIDWTNGEDVFPRFNREAPKLDTRYEVHLLADFTTPKGEPARLDFAGTEDWQTQGGERVKVVTPGSIILRGKSLGETVIRVIRVDLPCGGWDFPVIRVRGNDHPTQTERDFIKAQITPQLREYATAHADALRREAIQRLRERCNAAVAEARKQLDALALHAEANLSKL